MAESVSTPYTIVTTKGKTKLTGISRVRYSDITDPQNKQINNPVTIYYTEVSADEYLTLPDDNNRFQTSVSGVPGSFKFYKAVAAYRHDTGKFQETISTGADLKNEIGLFNAGKPNQLNTVIAAGNKAVSKQENIPLDQLNIKNTQAVKPPPEPELTEEQKQQALQQQVSESVINAVEGGREGLKTITSISANYRKKYDDLFYPYEMQNNKQDRIKFVMGRKSGSSIRPDFTSGKQAIERKESFGSILGSVTLPVQPSITDSNTVDWSGATLNAIQAFGAASAMRMIGSTDVTDLASTAGDILGQIAREITSQGDYAQALKTYFAQEAVGAQNLLSRTSGAILNPNLELLFNGPSLRPFAFTFRMSPRDEYEATQVRKIIRFFKQGMSVKTSSSNIFLQSPNIFRISYIAYDNAGNPIDHPSINRIKSCALLSCDVDYTPDGSYMTYADDARTMTSYQLSLRFNELEPIYDNDYTELDGDLDTTLGY